jgi:hypothetical protein
MLAARAPLERTMSTTSPQPHAAASLAALLEGPSATLASVAAHLDALDAPARLRAIRTLPGRLFPRLYALAAPLRDPELLVRSVSDGETVPWEGTNMLPALRDFQKPCAREGGAIVGYNVQRWSRLGGPGYYTVGLARSCPWSDPRVAQIDPDGQVVLDYRVVPERAPRGWPPPRDNRRLPGLYADCWDPMRRITDEVLIGVTTRRGVPIPAAPLFVLCRP